MENSTGITEGDFHGYHDSQAAGTFSVRTQRFDGEPEIVIELRDMEQLDMIRVVTPDGDTWRIERDR